MHRVSTKSERNPGEIRVITNHGLIYRLVGSVGYCFHRQTIDTSYQVFALSVTSFLSSLGEFAAGTKRGWVDDGRSCRFGPVKLENGLTQFSLVLSRSCSAESSNVCEYLAVRFWKSNFSADEGD